jgi:hypothetical protein
MPQVLLEAVQEEVRCKSDYPKMVKRIYIVDKWCVCTVGVVKESDRFSQSQLA